MRLPRSFVQRHIFGHFEQKGLRRLNFSNGFRRERPQKRFLGYILNILGTRNKPAQILLERSFIPFVDL
jgi:hypothetical protein